MTSAPRSVMPSSSSITSRRAIEASGRSIQPAAPSSRVQRLLDLAPAAPALPALVAGDVLGEHVGDLVAVDRAPAGAAGEQRLARLRVGDHLARLVTRVGEAERRVAPEGDPPQLAVRRGSSRPSSWRRCW